MDIPDAFTAIVDMVNAKYGLSMTADDAGALGIKVLKIEKDFNARAGFTAGADRLPDFFKREKLSPHDVVFDVPDEELDKTLEF